MNYKLARTLSILVTLLLNGCMSASFSGNYVVKSGETLRGDLFVTSGSVTLRRTAA